MTKAEAREDGAYYDALNSAPVRCRECGKEKSVYSLNVGQGDQDEFEPVLSCEEFPEGCDPNRCSREIAVTAEDLDMWKALAIKSLQTIRELAQEKDIFDMKSIESEILIDSINKKLKEEDTMRKWSIIKKLFKEVEERKTIDTKHGLERYALRYFSDFSKEELNDMIVDVKSKIISDFSDKEGQYGWHSKSTGAGGIIDWRPDFKNIQDKKNHAIIVTNFPVKKHHNFRDVNASIIIEQQVIEWAKEKGFGKRKIEENLCEFFTEKHDEYINSFYVAFFEGELNDFHLDGYILIN